MWSLPHLHEMTEAGYVQILNRIGTTPKNWKNTIIDFWCDR